MEIFSLEFFVQSNLRGSLSLINAQKNYRNTSFSQVSKRTQFIPIHQVLLVLLVFSKWELFSGSLCMFFVSNEYS